MKKFAILTLCGMTFLSVPGLVTAADLMVEQNMPNVIVNEAPPPEKEDVITISPGPNYLWVKGYWKWDNRWVWVPGQWVKKPTQNSNWVHGHWEAKSRGWAWIPGRWQ